MNRNVHIAGLLLRYSLAAFLLLMGADKAFHTELITDWEAYLGPVATTVLPFIPETTVRVQGALELICAGILLFTSFVRTGVALFFLLTLASIIDLSSFRYYVLIGKDLVLIAAGGALILLTPRK